MKNLIYLHGFLSSPDSKKAQQTSHYLSENHPRIQFQCPQLSPSPDTTKKILQALLEKLPEPRNIVGSSLGGWWATWLIEQGLGERAVLINPAVRPAERLGLALGSPLRNYYSNDIYIPGKEDIQRLKEFDMPNIGQPSRYWLMVQKGDEVLDYRLATSRYADCRQRVETGGNHAFANYASVLPAIMQFFMEPESVS